MKYRLMRKDTFFALILGAIISLLGSMATEYWFIPMRMQKIHQQQLVEGRFSKLYAPLVIITGKGKISLMGNITFYKVKDIMEKYGYLANPEVIEKYVAFLKTCKFASYNDLKYNLKLSDKEISEIIKQQKPPLKRTPDFLDKAPKLQEGFYLVLLKYYEKARKDLIFNKIS